MFSFHIEGNFKVTILLFILDSTFPLLGLNSYATVMIMKNILL